jgi:pimeloyl-ACP methyl ester carboxylesterase
MTLELASWIATGERVAIDLPSGRHEIFRRFEGSGPSMTLLHGFPTCSWDWAPLAARLRGEFRVLAFDFLGFGDSDKPRAHRYDLIEQADLVEAMWADAGIDDTMIVAHDYGVSVTKELLARHAEGRLRTRLRSVVLLNGILYEELHRPVMIQRLLLNPVTGPLVTRLVRERAFRKSFATVFSPDHPLEPADAHQHWEAVTRRDGTRIYNRLIRYLADGRQHAARWRAALHGTPVPCRFIWGMQDPVTGPPMLVELRRNLPTADIHELASIGHYPQLEAPDVVARSILA